jgi:hypothetical protein
MDCATPEDPPNGLEDQKQRSGFVRPGSTIKARLR